MKKSNFFIGVSWIRIVLRIKNKKYINIKANTNQYIMRNIATILLLFTLANLSFSQTVDIKKATGIVDFNAINAIYEKSGSIFISGTEDLIRIKGSNFDYIPTSFSKDENSFTIALAQDANQNIWTSTNDGFVARFDGASWEYWENIGSEFSYITAIAFDKYNNVWAAGGNKVYKYNGSEWTIIQTTVNISNHVNDIVCENDTVWITSDDNGLVKFDGTNWELFPINNQADINADLSLTIDEEGMKWLASSNFGVASFNGVSWTSFSATEYPKLANLKDIYVDNNNVLWVTSSTKGLSYLKDTTWSALNFNHGLYTNNYSTLVADAYNNKWFCSSNGVSFFDGENITNYLSENELPGEYIATLLFDSNDRIWISTFDGTTLIDSLDSGKEILNSELRSTHFNVIVEDLNGTIWAGSNDGVWMMKGGSWTKFTTDDGLINNTINDIAVDGENNKWFATMEGISRFNDYYWINYGETDGISSASVNYIKVNNKPEVWVSAFSKDNTVSVFNGEYWNKIDPELGEENYILSMEIDLNNVLWLGTSNGLYSYNGNNWQVYFNDSTPESTISDIAVDAMNNLIFMRDSKQVVKFNGSELKEFDEFDDFSGKIYFDNNGYAWGNNGEYLHRAASPEPYLKVPMRYVYFKENNENFSFKLIAANTNWNIETNQHWLYVDVASGQGNKYITITIMLDFFPEPVREATLSIYGEGIFTQNITVFQEASASTSNAKNSTNKTFELIKANNVYHVYGDSFKNLEVYTINGKKVIESTNSFFSTNSLKKGMYLVKINNNKSSFETHKIIIAK